MGHHHGICSHRAEHAGVRDRRPVSTETYAVGGRATAADINRLFGQSRVQFLRYGGDGHGRANYPPGKLFLGTGRADHVFGSPGAA